MENLEAKIPLCIWKTAAISDEKRRAEGASHATFAKDSKCAKCDGYDTSCPAYEGMLEKTNKQEHPNQFQKTSHDNNINFKLNKLLGMSWKVLPLTAAVYAALC